MLHLANGKDNFCPKTKWTTKLCYFSSSEILFTLLPILSDYNRIDGPDEALKLIVPHLGQGVDNNNKKK